MNLKSVLGLAFLLSLMSCQSTAQTFVGEVLYRSTYQYVKVKCEGDSCEFSMPFVDNQVKHSFVGNPAKRSVWEVQWGIEKWQFRTTAKDGLLSGTLSIEVGQQPIVLYQQLEAIPRDKWSIYTGVYADEKQRKAIVHTSFNSLGMMSPYTEETVSLKTIEGSAFWSVSGERSHFSDLKNGVFQRLEITDRFGHKNVLKREASFRMEELWIPVGEDTLYAQLYLPGAAGKVPACLLLPGGGGTGMDNYVFDAKYLAAYGVATLVFDKSGNGKSKGPNHFNQQNFEEKNDQYIALFNYLKKHPKVDASKTGVLGLSEGGRLALMMAIDLGDEIAFSIPIAAPIMTMKEGQFYAIDQHHRILNIDEIDNMKVQQIWDDYYTGISEGKIQSSTIASANHYRSKYGRLFLPPNSTQVPTSPKKEDLINDRIIKEAVSIRCPILLQYGENDQRVNPRKSLENFIPKVAGKNNIHVKIYPRGSHSMMTPEYKICPGYMDDKIKWFKMIGIL